MSVRHHKSDQDDGNDRSPAIIDAAVLEVLLGNRQGMTIQGLSQRLGISRDAVIYELDRLQQAGTKLERHPQHGVRLIEAGLGCWVDYLRWQCKHFPGRLIEVYKLTNSTQDRARRIVETKGMAANGALVVADEQAAGRGRLGRSWVAPAGSGVLMTRVCVGAKDDKGLTVDRLTLAAAVAVAKAVEEIAGGRIGARIKWPNDILVGERKLAGILVETFTAGDVMAAIVGVGLNVGLRQEEIPTEPRELREIVTSLAMCGCEVDRLGVLAEMATQMDVVLGDEDFAGLVEQWRVRSTQLSKTIDVRSENKDYRGQVVDLDPLDGLIFRTESGSLLHLPAATTTIL